MEFQNAIMQLSNRIKSLKDGIQTEEATKNAFIMPFIQTLGYDVFNPLEVIPEFTCDIGTKKGEKIDYAIIIENKPIMLIECKHWAQDLNLHDNQLLRYYNVSNAHFGVLTNGIVYKFYADLKEPNKMDEKPFLEINLEDPKEYQIKELKKFHKSVLDLESILDTASELKYTNEFKSVIKTEFDDPSPEFVKFFSKYVYDGQITQNRIAEFTPLVKKSISTYISDLLTAKISSVLKSDKEKEEETRVETQQEAESGTDSRIVTTEEELEAFMIVKAILRECIDVSRIAYRDALSYFAILFDDNNRKPICRLFFNGSKKYIVTFDENKKETRVDIETLDDIYQCSEELRNVAKFYTSAL